MANKPPVYSRYRGEPIVIGRSILSGDPAGYTITADLKPTAGTAIPASGTAAAASFDPSFVAAAGQTAAHWLLTIPASASAGLSPGRYVVQARLYLSSELVEITDPAFIDIRAAA